MNKHENSATFDILLQKIREIDPLATKETVVLLEGTKKKVNLRNVLVWKKHMFMFLIAGMTF